MRGNSHTQRLLNQDVPITASHVKSEATHETGEERSQETRGRGEGRGREVQTGRSRRGDVLITGPSLNKAVFILSKNKEELSYDDRTKFLK